MESGEEPGDGLSVGGRGEAVLHEAVGAAHEVLGEVGGGFGDDAAGCSMPHCMDPKNKKKTKTLKMAGLIAIVDTKLRK